MKISFKYEIKHNDKVTENELIDILLKNRRVKDKEKFLNPPHPSQINLIDFGYRRELKKTLKLLEKIKRNSEMVVVYTDYDADGITGGAILWETLHKLGFKVMPYVPHRKLEGYGFSKKGIDAVKKQYNPSLIISVDHGITAWEKVEYAKKLGIPVIITDHHLKPEKLPDQAEAIFHIPELSGSGVSYFFSKAIFEHFRSKNNPNYKLLITNFQTDYLSLASIGSVADLVPLLGATRSIVTYGLEAFDKCSRIGLNHIITEAGIRGRKITPYEIGFIIAPRINAVGRLEHALDALRLLCTTSDRRARDLAGHIGIKNRERQDLVIKAVDEARNMVNNPEFAIGKKKLIILESKGWHEGIIGLIASKICEEFYRPTIILTHSDGFMKGSARSIPGFHITNFLRSLKKYLIDVGGHTGAAGFTLEKNKYNNFSAAALKLSNKMIKDKDLERKIEVDVKIPLSKLNLSLAKKIETLQPFGIGNAKPTFYSQVKILELRSFGKKNEHLKMIVRDPKQKLFSFEFNKFYEDTVQNSSLKGRIIDVVYQLDINRWNGNENLRGKLQWYSQL